MSGKKSIIKTMLVTLVIGAVIMAAGAFLFKGAELARYESSAVPAGFEIIKAEVQGTDSYKTEGIVRKNRRVTRIIYEADVIFEYDGVQLSAQITGNPFLKTGDTTELLFNPSTGEIRHDFSDIDTIFALVDYIPALGLMAVGGIVILAGIISAIRKFSLFREKNKVYGVIVDVYENTNIMIDHKHPKKAICEVTDPVTGAVHRIESANSTMDVFSMVGMNVPIYLNSRKPYKSFVDLENADGELHLGEGQQRVHDFRNL